LATPLHRLLAGYTL